MNKVHMPHRAYFHCIVLLEVSENVYVYVCSSGYSCFGFIIRKTTFFFFIMFFFCFQIFFYSYSYVFATLAVAGDIVVLLVVKFYYKCWLLLLLWFNWCFIHATCILSYKQTCFFLDRKPIIIEAFMYVCFVFRNERVRARAFSLPFCSGMFGLVLWKMLYVCTYVLFIRVSAISCCWLLMLLLLNSTASTATASVGVVLSFSTSTSSLCTAVQGM